MKWVVNLSSKTLSSPQKSILSRGLNFSPAPRRLTIPQIVVAVESGLRCVSEESAERADRKW